MSTIAPTDVRVRTWLIGISADESADLLSSSELGRLAVIVNGQPLPCEPLFASVLLAPVIKFVLGRLSHPGMLRGCALTRLPGFSEVL